MKISRFNANFYTSNMWWSTHKPFMLIQNRQFLEKKCPPKAIFLPVSLSLFLAYQWSTSIPITKNICAIFSWRLSTSLTTMKFENFSYLICFNKTFLTFLAIRNSSKSDLFHDVLFNFCFFKRVDSPSHRIAICFAVW